MISAGMKYLIMITEN